MRRISAFSALALICIATEAANAAPIATTTHRTTVGWQVNDFFNAVKSAVTGTKNRRRRARRSRGSNTPILSTPPVLPNRRPARDQTAKTDSLKKLPSKIELRPTLVAAVPESTISGNSERTTSDADTESSIAVPARRPSKVTRTAPAKKNVRVTSVTPTATSETATDEQTVAPAQNSWEPEEISAAYDRCEKLLGKLTVKIAPVDPIRNGRCGTPGPVQLSALGESTSVSVRPAATLNCRTVARIHAWMENKVQPAAVKLLQSPVVRIRNVSSYACRNRNNAKSGKLSEHALGNALDIAGFVLADGRKISVLSDWGIVQRDRPKAEKQAAAAGIIDPEGFSRGTTVKIASDASYDSSIALPVFKGPVRRGVRLNPVPDPGEPALPGTSEPRAAALIATRKTPRPSAESRFLKQIHKEACGIFATVLGPEANDAHRDHFHLDTAERKYSAYCR